MTADDLAPLMPGATGTLALDEQARRAADSLRRATSNTLPPLDGQPFGVTGWLRVAALALIVVVVAVAAVGLGTGVRSRPAPAHPPHVQSASDAVVELAHQLAAGKFEAVTSRLEPGPPLNIDAATLAVEWQQITEAYGTYRSTGTPTHISAGRDTANATVTMSRGQLVLTLWVQPDGRLGGVGFEAARKANAPDLTYSYLAPKALAEAHALAADDVNVISKDFDPLLVPRYATPRLRTWWQQLVRAYGPLQSIGSPVYVGPGTYGPAVVNVPLRMHGGQPYLQVAFDFNGQIRVVVPLLPDPPSQTLAGVDPPLRITAATVAQLAVTDLADRDYQTLTSNFDQLATANLTISDLQQQWQTVTSKLGKLMTTSAPSWIAGTPAFFTYEIGLTFSHGKAHVQISIDTADQIQQLTISPGAPTRILGQ